MAKQRSDKSERRSAPIAPEFVETVKTVEPEPVRVDVPAPLAAIVEAAESRPSYEDFKSAAELGMRVEISLVGRAGPVLKAGYIVMREPRIHSLRVALDAGESHLRALATDPDLKVRILD